jgi:hypothetical protein
MMFKQMENISLFLAACRSLGVPSFDCFETNDLFQGSLFVSLSSSSSFLLPSQGSLLRCF